MAGILYVVATPIGNLGDITYRAVDVLKHAAVIACEDTRQTRKLLERYGIATATVSYHEHNEAERSVELLMRLERGESVALVSDAGTPLVSDPGFRLVQAAAGRGLQVTPVPGPSAVVAAFSAAGLESDSFRFCGFFPRKRGERERVLQKLKDETATLAFYEAPHRLMETLADIERILGGRRIVVARELTKIHEEILRGAVGEIRRALAERGEVRGEITVLIGRAEGQPESFAETVAGEVRRLEAQGMDRMAAIKTTARHRAMGKREVYRLVEGGSGNQE